MTVSSDKVILYAVDAAGYDIALGAASVAGISASQVTGDFYDTWSKIESGEWFVIAVGGEADNALYYNPCNWSNPSNHPGGTTPFRRYAPETDVIAVKYYANAGGLTILDTLKLASMWAYYAVYGTYPPGYGDALPATSTANNTCSSSMMNNQDCTC
ncbi:hypothetical protein [Alicyclobacillus sp. SP_1]|jgi:hypothetical protein|uniref:hypothetical protein n=1 Tax=Alicyclobacillus sp. SP_1 TaxID=2942475 RepID=UPI0021589865|nr:hypothetical protein [Alicyclobacillus sp. SP_1]